ncbi:pRL2-8 [Streptomyces sp. NPDC092903]|uniref:pRL2-8 n=1 Tax=Streptomyces sp. NPDC092903 TaxID=3366017 RepID=UPI00381C7770
MASQTPPPGECTQCWLHAHNSREVHAHLAPRQDCPQCVDHMRRGCPPAMIVPGKRRWF